jgi:tRNA A37 threonylcarbamoyladenosine synthetase subunit TsaC/SUA5/YrdC
MPATAALDTTAAHRALAAGRAAVLPNPSPLTYVVTAGTPHAVNRAKGRPTDQDVALWVHHTTVWNDLLRALDLSPGASSTALELLRDEMVTLLVPARTDTPPPHWATPAQRDGHLLLFGARWQPLAHLLDCFPRLYVSSANRTGQPPAATADQAAAMFGPHTPVTDADHLHDATTPHAATTTLRIAPDGALTHIRRGAQDQAHGPDPTHYLERLRTPPGEP